jgi:alcohol dehydrogenase class IV
MRAFVHETLPARVVFGAGAVERLPEEVDRLGVRRVLILCTQGQRGLAEEIAGRLGGRVAGVFDRAAMHVPVERAEEARGTAASLGADACLAVGGGSTIGLAKAIALTSGLPVVALPTTYSGSEMTPIYGLTERGQKRTGRDPRVLPRVVVYDPLLTRSLPARVAGPSGMNAIAHCVEALYAKDADPIVALLAEEGIRALSAALPSVVREPAALEARGEALYGAMLAGTCLGAVGMALHHKLCHTLGGSFGLPHAETHAVVLPHAAAYNRGAAADAMGRVARALGADDAATGLFDLARSAGAPASLAELGMKEADLPRAARLATEDPYWNPRPVEEAAILALLRDAQAGRRPTP